MTKEDKPRLTKEKLIEEYLKWPSIGRNQDDLRFGQYLYINYKGVPREVFMDENSGVVYINVSNYLVDVQR